MKGVELGGEGLVSHRPVRAGQQAGQGLMARVRAAGKPLEGMTDSRSVKYSKIEAFKERSQVT